jgi:hypothetical protein
MLDCNVLKEMFKGDSAGKKKGNIWHHVTCDRFVSVCGQTGKS